MKLPVTHAAVGVKDTLQQFLLKGVFANFGFVDRDTQTGTIIGLDGPTDFLDRETFLHNIISPWNIVLD
jgi:hypothetical protein